MMSKILMLFFLSTCAQTVNPADIKLSVLDYTSYHFTKEKMFYEMKQEIRIAYYGNYTLYRTTTFYDADTVKKMDYDMSVDVKTANKIYSYYVIKNGFKEGKIYTILPIKKKTFELEKFLEEEGLKFSSSFFNLDLGKPALTERDSKTNEVKIEKYAFRFDNEGNDSLYRYYDKNLAHINFSFSSELDKKAGSKLWQIGIVYNRTSKQNQKVRREAYWRIEKAKLNSGDEKSLTDTFKKFISEELK